MDLSSPETSFVQYAHVYPTKIVSSPYFSRRIAPEKAPAGGKAARCAGRGEGRAGTALSRKNAVHKERTPAKRPPAAPSPARCAGEIPVSKKNARQPNGRPLPLPPRAARGKSLFQKRTHVSQTAARCALPRAQRGKGLLKIKERTGSQTAARAPEGERFRRELTRRPT